MAQTQPLLKKRGGKHPCQGELGQGQALPRIERRKVGAMTQLKRRRVEVMTSSHTTEAGGKMTIGHWRRAMAQTQPLLKKGGASTLPQGEEGQGQALPRIQRRKA